ncbi:MAG: glutamate formimidoyltransferase [Candidatus Bipolaricaulota bacterium]|nr:glutamate formimidoyltransferase [Candidatus Bipolaricaulota bacterium]MCS7274438.1 glutamate formimidoyltransferase [Candidatus Bipolaricaulota bacterium]MDW8110867.1 glutamate formimidoyltransferase [Candidatus Bipolaricaulota bacterium]MDW8328652.1 glutamate formimidoyltransferase [Candidatus Bipolaricaulota bacterium]
MKTLVECVPNISEGRDHAKIERVVEAVRQTPGAVLLDVDPDADHHRTVITFVGEPAAVEAAVLRLVERAVELIDLTKHQGEHPRMGAVDVIPFVPLKNVTVAECVEMARRVGQAIWERFRVPVYFYEEAATRPERRDLANIRKGQFENYPKKIQEPDWAPDVGERVVHPTAGVTAVGVRPPLIAFNVNLGTSNLEIAKKIAKAVRGSDGGLRYVKALGLALEGRGLTQVSMNLTNFEKTPIYQAYELVKREAQRWGVPVVGSEIVGLVPQAALLQVAEYFLQLEDFKVHQVLENRLAEKLGE